jgi:CheY-like chemotaxis protein
MMKKVVVAESSPTIRSVSDNLLRQNGYNVVCTSDGLQAWEVINSEKPDLVLTGLNLSGISGLELCRQISGDNQVGGIPVVVMVGAKDDISEDELISTGARGRLKKPFSPRDLLIIIKKLIGEGENANQNAPVSGDTSRATSYQAKVLSTTRHLENTKGEVYNLDWTDLNDTGSQQLDISQDEENISNPADDQEITISENQFDLESLNAEHAENQGSNDVSSDDEDYDWFIGEMQKSTSKEKETPQPEKKIPEKSMPGEESSQIPGDEGLNFDDFGSPNTKIFVPEEKPIEKKTPAVQTESAGADAGSPGISDDELMKIADRVTQNLAAAIVANIDRQKIVEAIKSVIKK